MQFHLQWLDQDGGLCPDPLFGGDDTVYYKCFGELYTSPIGNITWFKDEDQGSFSFVCVNSRDTIDITASWFTERGIDVKTLTEADGLRLVRAAHPDHAVFVARSATEDECLNRAVVDRVEKLNELIAETWGTDWFPGNNKVRGEVRFEDLSGDEYDRLIAERYPVCILCRYPLPSRWNEGPYLCECPPMTDEEKKTELERRHAKALADRIQSDDATDYFANLARQSERE